jgi:hypothetical protein
MKKLFVLTLLLLPFIAQAQYVGFCGSFTNTAPISLNGVTGQTIRGDSINGKGNTTAISLTNCSNIHITRSKFVNCGKAVAIYLYNCANITIDSCMFEQVGAGVYALSCPLGYIVIQHNYGKNAIRSFAPTVQHGQFVQLNAVTGPGNRIRYNHWEDFDGQSDPEDGISSFQSGGTAIDPLIISNNFIRRHIPISRTGSGMMLGDSGGSYTNAFADTVISPGNVGIGIAGGTFINATGNVIYSPPHPGSTVSNAGLVFNNFTAGLNPCNNNTMTGNIQNWYSDRFPAVNDYYAPGSCTTFGANTYGAAISASLLTVPLSPQCSIVMVFNSIPSKIYGVADFSPGAASPNPITYTSSNLAVCTIVANKIHVTGTGTSNITAFDGVNTIIKPVTINQASLLVVADNYLKTYGDNNPSFTATITGFAYGENSAVLTSLPSFSTSATSASIVGTYAIVPSSATASNYTFVYNNGTLTVNKASLTITADNKTKPFSTVNPTLTASYTGLVNGDTPASLTTLPTLTTTAVTGSPVGTYPITISGASGTNYNISYTAGTMTVSSVSMTFNSIAAQIYGAIDFNPGALSSIAITYTSSNPSVATIVSNQIHITGTGLSNITADNGSIQIMQPLTVNKKSLVIMADNKSKTVNTVNPSFTASYLGFAYGETNSVLLTQPTIGTLATTSSPIGTYMIFIFGASATNYNISYVSGVLTINTTNIRLGVSIGTVIIVH